jgi:uncharacterized protein (DUF305 family)
MPFRYRLLVPALLAAVSLAGCGGMGGGMFGREKSMNSTDAAFVRAMMAHERTVGSITQLGRRKAMRVELRGIARDRLARHGRNLGALRSFGADLRGRRVAPLGARTRRGPPRYDPRALREAVSFDHEFLVKMIEQEEYAMAAAAVERDRGGDWRVKALAREMHHSSEQNLIRLRHWLHTWYGGGTQPGLPPGPPPGGGGGSGGGAGPGPDV